MRRSVPAILFSVLVFATSNAFSANYADCILDKMPGSENEAVTSAVVGTCLKENPGSFYTIAKGSGRGLFGFNDSNACTLKKARDTRSQRAAALIASSCRCLYGEPEFSDEPCATRPVPWGNFQAPVPKSAPESAAPAAIPTPPPNIARAPPPPRKPSPSETKETIEKRTYDAQVQADLNFIAARAMSDYPYLDTPDGQVVMDLIIRRRNQLIQQGVYPSIALTQAVNAYAPANAPRPVKEKNN